MLNLLDYLTEKDNTLIENYIDLYAVSKEEYVGNETWLKYWNENKPSLFRLLGGNLIYKIPYEVEKPTSELRREIARLTSDHPFIEMFYKKVDGDWDIFGDYRKSPLHKEIDSNGMMENTEDIRHLCNLIIDLCSDYSLANKSIGNSSFKIKNKNRKNTLQISKGMKPLRAIQTVLKYFDCLAEDEELWKNFKDFETKYSMILNTSKIRCNICFSIHPLDFMTSSDNANNWSSCMNWTDEDGGGCYHEGTIEMMNSNNVICVYLDSSTPFVFKRGCSEEDAENYTWNNKKWRQYFYCTKEIILSGKSYPYYSEEVTMFALKTLRDLAEKNWGRTYEFGPEPYRDMIHICSKGRVEKNRNWISIGNTTKHNIIFDTKGMYNDMLNDNCYSYFCVRNKVKKNTIISCSGKAPCPRCMESIIEESVDWECSYGDYNDRYENTGSSLCLNCKEKCSCTYCGKTGHVYTLGDARLCEDCWDRYVKICPDCGKPYVTNSGLRDLQDEVYILHEKTKKLKWEDLTRSTRESDSGEPYITNYACCDDCLEKLKENSRDQLKEIPAEYTTWYSTMFRPVLCFKDVKDFKSDFVQKHLKFNLQKAPIERDLT